MTKEVNNKIINAMLVLVVVMLVASLSFSAYASWTGPTDNPPNGNTDAPLNDSNMGQTKSGGLILNTAGNLYGLSVPLGRVGIGTAAPNAKLDIDMTNLTTTEGLRISRDAAASHYAYLNIENESANSIFKVHESGKVGIGINNPSQRLEVAGKIKLSDDATAPSSGTMRWNSGTLKFEGYNGSAWVVLDEGGSSSANTWKIPIRFTRNTIAHNSADNAKDTRCNNEFGADYVAATVKDVTAMPGGMSLAVGDKREFNVIETSTYFFEGSAINYKGQKSSSLACVRK